ncbi:MFS transporter [Sphingomonas sp. CFBP 8760]|uniref:MFS transporter n=1 Tax=Sphingomonas sp. CFBP 8760 TaxID=2775282 RepID=UPI00177A9102|nr:MFS transporter [Sphingomonas sp. CFBP 8760]MBD8545158.1 MFS transporter [Sphingomonas sp. CFBP 8760]
MAEDPRRILSDAPMRRPQVVAIALCVLLNALDGFDVLSISFASPGIAKEWSVDRAALGIVLSMELIGMMAGSIGLGALCDRIGRRPTILACLAIMGSGMAMAMHARNIEMLSVFRLFTGVGIGGMLAATNAVTAEFANARRRSMAIAIMATGYPIGAIVGGSIASMMFAAGHDWRSVFAIGAVATALCIPLTWFLLPETVSFLVHKRRADALERVNAVMRRLGHAVVDALPASVPGASRGGIGQLFRPGLAAITMLLTLAYFAHIMTFYFILKWTPKIVADMGFSPSSAGGVLVWANIGGATGSLVLSLLTQKLPVRWLTIGAMLLSTAMVAGFGHAPANLATLSLIVAIAGFCTNGAIVGMYAMIAQSFPTALRASGTGFAIGVGRGGAALSPIVAGFMFQGGIGFAGVALTMALGSVVAAGAVFLLRYEDRAALTG